MPPANSADEVLGPEGERLRWFPYPWERTPSPREVCSQSPQREGSKPSREGELDSTGSCILRPRRRSASAVEGAANGLPMQHQPGVCSRDQGAQCSRQRRSTTPVSSCGRCAHADAGDPSLKPHVGVGSASRGECKGGVFAHEEGEPQGVALDIDPGWGPVASVGAARVSKEMDRGVQVKEGVSCPIANVVRWSCHAYSVLVTFLIP